MFYSESGLDLRDIKLGTSTTELLSGESDGRRELMASHYAGKFPSNCYERSFLLRSI